MYYSYSNIYINASIPEPVVPAKRKRTRYISFFFAYTHTDFLRSNGEIDIY